MDEPNSERIITPMPKALVAAIDDYRFTRRIASRAEAVRRLIEAGLKVASQPRSVGPEDEVRGGDEAPGVPAPPRDD